MRKLSTEKRAMILTASVEGNSIAATTAMIVISDFTSILPGWSQRPVASRQCPACPNIQIIQFDPAVYDGYGEACVRVAYGTRFVPSGSKECHTGNRKVRDARRGIEKGERQ